MGCGEGIQLIEEGHAHGEVGVGKQLDGLGLGAVGEQHGGVLFQSTFQQQVGKGAGTVGLFAHDDAAGVQVVVQGLAFAQEFGAEDKLVGMELRARCGGKAHRYGGLDDHDRLRGDLQHAADDGFDAGGVEGVGDRVGVGGGGNDDEVGAFIGPARVERGAQVEGFVGKEALDVGVFDGRVAAVDLIDLGGVDVERDHIVMLCQQGGHGQADVAGSGDGDFHAFVLIAGDACWASDKG